MTDTLTAAVARRALPLLDLTDLNDDCDETAVAALCAKADGPHGRVAAVCVWPRFAALARAEAHAEIKVAVVANFPGGQDDPAAVADSIAASRAAGADEIDVVLNWRALDNGAVAARGLRVAREAAGSATLKVILETGALTDSAQIDRAAGIAVDEGADFLKTSTGKTPAGVPVVGATPEAVRILLARAGGAGRRVGVKASGGIKTIADAAAYLALADEAMGDAWTTPETWRFGASGLLTALETALAAAQETGAGGA